MADYKAIADQLRSELGRNPTGTEILAVARATPSTTPTASTGLLNGASQSSSAVDNVRSWLASNPDASDAEIASAAKQYNVSSGLLAEATGLDQSVVDARLNAVDELQKTYDTYLEREADQDGLDYWTNQINSGALTLDQAKLAIATSEEAQTVDPVKSTTAGLYGSILERAPDAEGLQFWSNEIATALENETDPTTIINNVATAIASSPENVEQDTTKLLTGATQGNIGDFGRLLYLARQSDSPLDSRLIESIGYSTTDDKTGAYNYSVGAQAYAEGLEALDQARASGDTAKVQELEAALADEQGFYAYYLNNIAADENQAHVNLRKETATGDVFGIGDPGKYQTSLFEQLGDTISDIAQNPVVQSVVSAINPLAGSLLNIYGTLDSGDKLNAAQIIGTAINAGQAAGAFNNIGLTQSQQDFVKKAATGDLAGAVAGEIRPDITKAIGGLDLGTGSKIVESAAKGAITGATEYLLTGDEQKAALSALKQLRGENLDVALGDIRSSDILQGLSDALAQGEDVAREFLATLDPNISVDVSSVSEALAQFDDTLREKLSTDTNYAQQISEALAKGEDYARSLLDGVDFSGLPSIDTSIADIGGVDINIPTPDIDLSGLGQLKFPELPEFKFGDFTIPQQEYASLEMDPELTGDIQFEDPSITRISRVVLGA